MVVQKRSAIDHLPRRYTTMSTKDINSELENFKIEK